MADNSQKDSDSETGMDEMVPSDQMVSYINMDSPNQLNRFSRWKKGGRLFSILLIINLLILGCSLITLGSIKEVPIKEPEALAFLSTLMLLSILWMFFQMYFTYKNKNAVLYKDSHAGPIWLRVGLLLFGICTIVLDGFKIGHYVGYISCVSLLRIIFPVIQVVFVIVQMYFLWVSSKHCVQIYLNRTRCGLMLLLATNLAVWMTTVTDETSHLKTEMEEEDLKQNHTEKGNLTRGRILDVYDKRASDCECNNICLLLRTVYYYLYPFNLEFSLFACAMSYVMWKNVGRLMDNNAHHPHHVKLNSYRQIPCVGLFCGVCMLALGIALFVVYELQLGDEHRRSQVLTAFYIFHVICLSLMSLGALGGCIVYKFDRRQMDNLKNPSRSLDVGLLLLAMIGHYCLSYYSIVAMVAGGPGDLLRGLTLAYSLLMIVQLSMQNVFITEGLHRQIPEERKAKQKAPLSSPIKSTEMNSDSHSTSGHSLSNGKRSSVFNRQRLTAGSVRVAIATSLSTHRKRRRLLREIYVFMLLGNILFWILPAFGVRLRFHGHLEANFYGQQIWVLITNLCLPFGIFYRMHAAACLVELCLLP
ncbi:proton channel OTOP2-like [Ambystoma mexicanum]|uniref:proton channel OTOP2-like n=1 Tax=Ambystoma mexicanum TaxID=8296 RepID=UPI0037E96E40